MKRLLTVAAVIIVFLIFLLGWWKISLSPVNSNNSQSQTFVIAKGDGVREIAKKLHDQGLIRDQISFFLLVKKLGLEKNIQAGTFKLSPSLSANDLANKLTVGTEDLWITIPEGWRNEEIKDYLAKNLPAVAVDPVFKIASWKQYEGKFFPDTYLVPKQIGSSGIMGLMLDNFSKKINFPVSSDQLIIASLVEREAKTETDRPLVASIIYNRIKAGMVLNIDATVQYAIGYTQKDGWWKKELTTDDLKFKSPYNTYLNAGLPPGPICNPGLSAIKAAVSPAETSYFYYISDKQGHMHYAKTLEEHNQNVAKYL